MNPARQVAAACLLCSLVAAAPACAADTVKLPDGTAFVFWERPLTFSHTYFVDGNQSRSDDQGTGSLERPFRTISQAAKLLQPGERVVIAGGTYRETVRPARGGTGADQMISYEAAPGELVIVKGSEVLRDGWLPSTDPIRGEDQNATRRWQHELASELFQDAYNPFGMVNVPGDWVWLDTKRVDMGPYFRRRGLVFLDGRPLEPVEQYRELGTLRLQRTDGLPRNGLPGRSRGDPIMQEIGGTQDGRFWVEPQGNVLHVRVPGGELGDAQIEVTTREQAFAPRLSGLGYIRIKGITFAHAGNAFPPPQRGLVSTNGGHHWIIEGNTIEWANGQGLDIGSQHWSGARDPQAGASHIVRGNSLRYIGVEGIGGMGTSNALIEDNLIEWVGWQDAERAWEAAGAKFHRATNLLFRRNVVRHIRHANALWLDSGNTNSRITANVFADVLTVSAAIHLEMNRGANRIDNNVIWDVRNAEPDTPGQRGAAGSGIFLHASERETVDHNLIGQCENVGVFPILRPERQNAGNGQAHQVDNNVFAHCGNGGIVFLDANNAADGNVFAGMLGKAGGFATGDRIEWLDLGAWRVRGWDLHGRVADAQVSIDAERLQISATGKARLPLPTWIRDHNIDPRFTSKEPQ